MLFAMRTEQNCVNFNNWFVFLQKYTLGRWFYLNLREKVTKGSRRHENWSKSKPKGGKSEPKGAKREPKGAQREPKVRPISPIRSGFGDGAFSVVTFGLVLVPFLMKKTIKKRCARTLYSSTRKLMEIRCKNSLRIKRKVDFFPFFPK